MAVSRQRSGKTMYLQRLLEANEDAEEAIRGIREFSHSLAIDKLLDCYFSIVRFDLEFKNAYSVDSNGVDPYQMMALHIILVKKQFDIDNLLMLVNRNTVQSNLSVLQRLFTNNRAFGEVVSILNKVTDLSLNSKSPQGDSKSPPSSPLPAGLSRFDMSVARGFDSIIGQERAVKKVRDLIEKSVTVAGQPLSFILYGPPGTGKTSIALAVGREYKLNVYTVSVASLGGHFIGEREKNTVEIFDYLESRRDENLLLFVDEADSFLSVPGADDSQQKLYTRAVTLECFNRFLRPREEKKTAVVDADGNGARILLMATNFERRIAEEIRHRSVMILIDLPRSFEDMYRTADFYRQANHINMTRTRLERIVHYCLVLELAPSHVSQIMRRIATQVLLDMLKRGVIINRYTEFGKRSRQNPLSELVLPYFTVGGIAVKQSPNVRDTVVKLFSNSKRQRHKTGRDRVVPLSGHEGQAEIPASAIYPSFDGDVERFFRSFANFDRLAEVIGSGGSTADPEFVAQDNGNSDGETTDEIVDRNIGTEIDSAGAI